MIVGCMKMVKMKLYFLLIKNVNYSVTYYFTLIKIFNNDDKIGAGLCGTEGGMTVELEIMEVDREDFSFVHSSLETSIQTFTKGDGEIVSLFFEKPCLLNTDKLIKLYFYIIYFINVLLLLCCRVYMLSALIKGSESHCCEDCMECCVAAGVRFNFHVWESPNGTNEQRGQFPELYIRVK